MQELRQSGIVKNFKTGCLFTKTFKDSFSGKDFVDWAIKNKNVEKDKAIEMGQELISRKFGFGIHKTEEFKYEPDAIYQLGSGLGSSALNQGNLLHLIKGYRQLNLWYKLVRRRPQTTVALTIFLYFK